MYKEIQGDIFSNENIYSGNYDVIAQGNNCFCVQGGGIAPFFVKHFQTDKFWLENNLFSGDINKLGTIDFEERFFDGNNFCTEKPEFYNFSINVVNCYTQFGLADRSNKIPLDYEALRLCMKKINYIFPGKRVILPQIGAGLAKGDWNIIKSIIQEELIDCDVTVIIFKP